MNRQSYDSVLKPRPIQILKLIQQNNPDSLRELTNLYGKPTDSASVTRITRKMKEDNYLDIEILEDVGRGGPNKKPVLTEKGKQLMDVVDYE